MEISAGDFRRQGDIALVRSSLTELPESAVRVDQEVIHVGEGTNTHRLAGLGTLWADSTVMVADRPIEIQWIVVEEGEGAEAIHEEHTAQPMEPGIWEVVKQRQLNPQNFAEVVQVND